MYANIILPISILIWMLGTVMVQRADILHLPGFMSYQTA